MSEEAQPKICKRPRLGLQYWTRFRKSQEKGGTRGFLHRIKKIVAEAEGTSSRGTMTKGRGILYITCEG